MDTREDIERWCTPPAALPEPEEFKTIRAAVNVTFPAGSGSWREAHRLIDQLLCLYKLHNG